MNPVAWLHARFVHTRRVNRLLDLISEITLPYFTVLDLGCGDGMLGAQLMERNPRLTVSGVDTLVRPKTFMPVQQFNGSNIPFPDASFDAVLLADVIHHTQDGVALLREASRVARHAVIIKDHLRQGVAANLTLRLMDWFGNSYTGVALPYNYWDQQQWDQAFRQVCLTPVRRLSRLALYPWPASIFFDRRLHFIAHLQISDPARPASTHAAE